MTASTRHIKTARMKMASGVSTAIDTVSAAYQASEQCINGLGEVGSDAPDVAIVFFSPHHLTSVAQLSTAIRRRLGPKHLIGVSCEAVIGGAQEYERAPGVSILAARLPGVSVKTFATEEFPASDDSPESLFMLRDVVGAAEDLRCTILLGDPFSLRVPRVLSDLNRAVASPSGGGVVFGGLASASMVAGGNALLLDDRLVKSGGVGVSLKGDLRVDTLVSQGCKPFGNPMTVTKSQANIIYELDGKPAVETIQRTLDDQGKARHKLLTGGMFIGIASEEGKKRLGRDDFIIRKIAGVRPEEGAILSSQTVNVGQVVRLHTRDASTAHDDLAMLLDGQKLYSKPVGALLASCNGRGNRLFGERNHDANAVTRAFSQPAGGEELSKLGTAYYSGNMAPPIPLCGFFTAGEISPMGSGQSNAGKSMLHSQTACVAIFRERE